jgi:uncharacterized iron-regulated protein
LTPAQLVERLAGAKQVLLGEQHDNPDQHALQLWLLRALSQQREQGSLLLEMLNPAQQERVSRLQAAPIAEQLSVELPAKLGWQSAWAWSQYGAIVRYAVAQPAPLLAANLDRDEIMRIYAQPPRLHGAASSAKKVQEALLVHIRQSHCGLLPETQLPAMLAVQQQRDRRMAEVLQASPEPALLIAGAYHVRRDLGVPLHLADLDKQSKPLVLMLAEVGQPLMAGQADFVWYSPALPEQDYCIGMRAK